MSEPRTLTVDEAAFEPRAELDRLQRRAFLVGGAAALVTVLGYFLAAPAAFFRAYLVGWLLSFGVAGGLFVLGMLNHVSGGLWGVMMRRVSEAAGRTLPFLFLLFLPLLTGLDTLYPWADEARVAGDSLLAQKTIYLNRGFFVARLVIFFALWSGFAYALSAWSRRQDREGAEVVAARLKKASAAGLVVWVLTTTLASVDWVMSLDPHWFSSLFGVAFVAGHGLSGLAFVVVFMLYLSRGRPFAGLVKPKLFHDYGKLMLAFIMLWGYFMISQYLIIWSGNLPEEITWYMDRSAHGWKAVTVLLVLGHFALPFALLLSQDLKLHAKRLLWVAVWVLLMRWLDFYWQVAPAFSHERIAFHWLDVTAPVAIGGIWLGLLVAQFKGRPVLPVRDPKLVEVVAHG